MNAQTKAIMMSDEPMKGELIIAPQGKQNPAAVFLASKKGLTRSTYLSSLNKIARMIGFADCFTTPWESFRYAEIAAIQSRLSEIQKYTTTNRDMSGLKGLFKTLWRMDLITAGDYLKAVDVDNQGGSYLPGGRHITGAELEALIRVCVNDPKESIGARDVAIMAVTFPPCGLRRAEVTKLDLEDYNQDTGELLVNGKGNKQRLVYPEAGGRMAIDDWIKIRGQEPGALFQPIKQCGEIQNRRMSKVAINLLLKRRGEQASIAGFTPHDLRRTTATDLFTAGVDALLVSKIMGHASVNTTLLYDFRPEEAKRDASKSVRFAYAGRPDASGQGKMAI